MNLKTALTLLIMAVSGTGLVACGGGSSSSGGSSDAGSNLIVRVSDSNTAYFQSSPGTGKQMMAVISDFLISDAMAQTEATVCVYDSGGNQVECKVTEDGVAMFLLTADTYDVCIDGGNCQSDVDVDEDSITTVTVTCDDSCDFADVAPTVVVQPISELEQVAENDSKVVVCHIPPGNPEKAHTINISTNALPAHLAHGDTEAPCGDGTNIADDGQSADAGEPSDG